MKSLDAVLTKLKWRSAETQNKNNHKKQIELQEQQNNQVKPTFNQLTQINVQYTIGNFEQELNFHELTPCLVNVNRNLIYFCSHEILEQFYEFHQQKQHLFKDQFDKIKNELQIIDTRFQNFKSTLCMIEEIDDSQRSQLNFYSSDVDGFLNLETPETFSKPVYANPIETITHSALKYIHRWKTDSQLNDRRRNSVTIPRSLPNLIQIQT
ncbi:unnamed protein product [Paramecium sonneborni]|uniref:Uncharacterized protein n=1 Tax=Paramecium sonneborni TaxID=65129 RepID=A0A8S1QH78_9CILI|nr:unnamed protein product [Paramecium sonneborni]